MCAAVFIYYLLFGILFLVFFVDLKGEYGVLIAIFYSLANIIFIEIGKGDFDERFSLK